MELGPILFRICLREFINFLNLTLIFFSPAKLFIRPFYSFGQNLERNGSKTSILQDVIPLKIDKMRGFKSRDQDILT